MAAKKKPDSYDENCWCKPVITSKGGYTIITHKHPDGTLIYQRELPAPQIAADWKKTLGKRILDRRKQLDYNQTQLARLAGINPTPLGSIEKGRAGLALPTLMRIAKALELSLDELTAGILKDG